jgi:hypothetical protein
MFADYLTPEIRRESTTVAVWSTLQVCFCSGPVEKRHNKLTTKTCNIADRSPTVFSDRRTYADGRRRSPYGRALQTRFSSAASKSRRKRWNTFFLCVEKNYRNIAVNGI